MLYLNNTMLFKTDQDTFVTEVCVQSLIHHENKLFESYDPTQIDFRFKDMHIKYFEIHIPFMLLNLKTQIFVHTFYLPR